MYKPIYDRASVGKRIAEIFTWVFLLFLIPTTALGYFAEGSIPGQPLYPMKRGIENVVLTLQFFNRNSQAAYQVNLVNKRFNEAEQLLTMDTSNAQDLQNLSSQLETTKNFLLSMPDSPEKRQIQQTLIVNIQQYQQKIQQQQQVLQNRQQILQIQLQQNFGQQNFTQQQQAPTPTQAQQQNQQLTNFNNPPPPTYTPAPTSTQQTTDSSIQNTEQ
ncbi:MAG: hypothetical protein KGJ07_10525, partial [Patescibacteria group bacterium]|nr:hypothetical protein [Patescibacteria group bacterium]